MRVGDEELGAVERPRAVALGGAQLDAVGLPRVVGLGVGEGEDLLAGGDGGEKLLLLRRVASMENGLRAEHRRGEVGAAARRLAHDLIQHAEVAEAHAQTAVLLGDDDAGPAELGHRAPEVGVEARGAFVDLAHPFLGKLLLQEVGAHGLEHQLLLVKR